MLLSLGLIDGVEVLLETGTRTIPIFTQLVMSSKLPSCYIWSNRWLLLRMSPEIKETSD